MGVKVQFLSLNLPAPCAPVQGRPEGAIAALDESAGSLILVLAGLHALTARWQRVVLREETLRCFPRDHGPAASSRAFPLLTAS